MKGTLACGILSLLLCWNTLLQGAPGRDTVKYHEAGASVSTLQINKDFRFLLQALDIRFGLHANAGTKGFRFGAQAGFAGYFFRVGETPAGHNRVFRNIRDRKLFFLLASKFSYHKIWSRVDFFVEGGFAVNFPLYAEGRRISVNLITGQETNQLIKYSPTLFLLPEVSCGIRLPKKWCNLGAGITYGYDFRPSDGADNSGLYSALKIGLSLRFQSAAGS